MFIPWSLRESSPSTSLKRLLRELKGFMPSLNVAPGLEQLLHRYALRPLQKLELR